MATTARSMTSREVNGSAMAALLGGGIGAFAMGAVMLLNEADDDKEPCALLKRVIEQLEDPKEL